jgi:hypothetical protein
MKNRSFVSWGAIGAVTLVAVGSLAMRLGADGGFWGSLLEILSIPAAYIWAILLSFLYGTVSGPPSSFRVFFLVYMGALGFFVGGFLNTLRIRWKEPRD